MTNSFRGSIALKIAILGLLIAPLVELKEELESRKFANLTAIFSR